MPGGRAAEEEEEEVEVEEKKEEEGEKEEEEEQACTPPLRPQRQLRSCCGNTRAIPLYPFCFLWVGLIVHFKN